MRRKVFALAALMSVTLLSSCAQNNMNAIIMQNYTLSSRIASANSNAASLQSVIDAQLSKCDRTKYGMKNDDNSTTCIYITITNGEWQATITNPDSFNTNGDISWYNDNIGSRADDDPQETDNAVTMLEIELAQLYRNIENAYAAAYLESGKTTFVYFTEDTNRAIPEMDALLNSESARESYKWKNSTGGICSEGYIVGTAPMI